MKRLCSQAGMYAIYYNDEEKSEVEILLDLWSKYHRRSEPYRNYGREILVDKPMPNNEEGRTLCLMIEFTSPGDEIEQDERLKENMLEDTL